MQHNWNLTPEEESSEGSENPYDNPSFFEKYSRMPRSLQGLAGAGEWETLKPLLPPFSGKEVLDLGCGMGWHCAYAADQGAKRVTGVDISQRMLEQAVRLHSRPVVTYQQASFLHTAFPQESFDVVLCSLMLHYLPSYEDFLDRVSRWLRPGGTLVYNVEHPVFTAAGSQDWDYDAQGKIRHFPVDRYFLEGSRDAVFLGEHMTKYHRTLTTYLEGLLLRGFRLRHVVEPKPTPDMLKKVPSMEEELRRPMMLIVVAEKDGEAG